MTVREFSYGGPPKPPPIKVKDSFHVDQCIRPSQNYVQSNKIRSLSNTKYDHLRQMYQKFIAIERHPQFITQ